MKCKSKGIIDGTLFLLVGFSIIGLWRLTGSIILTTTYVDDVCMKSSLAGEIARFSGIPVIAQMVLFFALASFFIGWGIWTITKQLGQRVKPAVKTPVDSVVIDRKIMKTIVTQFFVWLPTIAGIGFHVLTKINRVKCDKGTMDIREALGPEGDYFTVCQYVLGFHILFVIFLIVKKMWPEMTFAILNFLFFFVLFITSQTLIFAF